ncbi:hypothetical protein AK812_SmicGene17966 [Symbiodinium microadriaticum]|uniref:Uncharacterized protein n=1 Tax=Symbiodinium microadriaticum TaxID=2951 RepID=A0A1Q9DWC8_SYMMI|nr:hypothetical protein AK812_SmicGene17966 [Symbiodinium microadriaticum]
MHALAGPLSKKLSQLMLMMLALAAPLSKLCQLMLMMLALAAPLSKLCQLMLMMLGLAGPLSKPCQLMLVMLGLTAPLSKPSQLMLMMLGLTAPLSKKALPADAHVRRDDDPPADALDVTLAALLVSKVSLLMSCVDHEVEVIEVFEPGKYSYVDGVLSKETT